MTSTAVVAALEPRELSALGAFELGQLLNEIDTQSAAFTGVAVRSIRLVAECEVTLLSYPDDLQARTNLKIHRASLAASRLQISALNKRQSRIQSILKSIIV